MPLERLQKILARAGIASRRNAEQLIRDGRVKVNGKIINELGTKADPDKDHIKVDTRLIQVKKLKTYYYLCYKPKKMIVTLNDPQNRPSIGGLLKEKRIRHRIFPVGRLDWDAEGLLILTSDGELANQIMHPKNRLPKVYIVEVIGQPAENSLEKLRNGIFIEPGVKTMAAQIAVLKNYPKKTILKVTIFEGRKNQIKKMFSRVGHFVIAIKRIAVGQLNLSGLKPGDVRPLSGTEIRELKKRVEKVIT